MSAEEWADVVLRGLDIVFAWPLAALVALLLVRGQLPAAGSWLGKLIEKRGISAGAGPLNLTVPPPDPATARESDEAAAKALAQGASAEVAEKLRALDALLGALGEREQEVREAWEEVAVVAPDTLPLRIAERVISYWEWAKHDIRAGLEARHQPPARAFSLAMLRVVGERAFADASYDDWLKASEIIRGRGYAVDDRPFSRLSFDVVERESRSHYYDEVRRTDLPP